MSKVTITFEFDKKNRFEVEEIARVTRADNMALALYRITNIDPEKHDIKDVEEYRQEIARIIEENGLIIEDLIS